MRRIAGEGMTARLGWAALAVAGPLLATPAALAEAPLQRLEVDTASGAHLFQVEVMSTEAERAQGLMNRRSLAKDHGMLFDFHRAAPVAFWMKNTFLPLDMIFVGADGKVVSVKHGAKPLDETPIPSGGPTLGVIEVIAGVADAIGVKPGDEVKHPIFHNAAGPAR